MPAEPATLLELLAHARRAPPEAGLRFLDRREKERWLSWAEIARRARAIAGRLAALGVQPGRRVALVYPTCPEFFDAFFGILEAGAVPVPLYPPVRLGRLEEYHRRTALMLRAVEAVLVLADGRVRRLLGETLARGRPALGCRTLADLPAGVTRAVRVAPSDLALVQFSSGTTMDPKPVALSHRALLAQTLLLNRFWPDTDELRHSGVSWLPLYHDMGLIGCILPALERGTALTLIGPEVFVARPAVWLRAISRYRATVSPAPNFAYALCVHRVRDEEIAGLDLSCWRVALNGAEAVAPGVLRAFQERFAPCGLRPEALTPVYGLSEASLAVTFSDLHRPFTARRFDRDLLAAEGRAVEMAGEGARGREIISVGRPLPGFDLRVVDAAARPLPEGRVGEVEVRGPSLMEGYLGRPEATAAALRDGWLRTGDLGFLHRGELYLTGRAKDVVILRGRNFSPEEMERAAYAVPGARPGCAVAVSHLPEGAEGEELLLFVELARGATEEQHAALPEACREAVLGAVGVEPARVIPLAPGTLPRTSSGKLRRGETLRRHLDGELAPPRPVNPLTLTTALARSALAYARLRLRRGRRGT